jgi:hypothetical protein
MDTNTENTAIEEQDELHRKKAPPEEPLTMDKEPLKAVLRVPKVKIDLGQFGDIVKEDSEPHTLQKPGAMKYELILFERGETPTDLKTTVICAHHSREAIDKFIAAGKNCAAIQSGGFLLDTRTSRKGRAVRVVSVSRDSFVSGFTYADTFPSAQAASNALLYGGARVTYNIVLKSLDALKHLPPSERIAEIEGIGFQYEEDFLEGVRV